MSVEELFYYDETSESFLRWNQPRYSAKNNSWMCRKVGDLAGTRMKAGHWRVSVDRKGYLVHRLIWELFNGPLEEGLVIDHIDKNPSNNNIGNLRLVTNAVNSRNSSMYSTNSTGVTGVTYWEPANRPPRYSAHWREDGKLKTKTFSVAKYGKELALELATNYRKSMIEKLNEQGAEYSATHGESK